MKVLFLTGMTFNSIRISDVQFELLYKHILNGDDVYCVLMDKPLVNVAGFGDPKSSNFRMNIVHENFRNKIKKLSSKITLLEYESKVKSKIEIPIFKDVEELKKFLYRDINIGMGVASSLISGYRDHRFDTNLEKKTIDWLLSESMRVTDTIINYSQKYNPDMVYIFNGRGAITAPLVRLCIKNKISFKTYELVSNPDEYDLIDSAIPHDIDFRHSQINDLWKDSKLSYDRKVELAQNFYNSNKNGNPVVGINFTGLQKEDKSIDISSDKEIITFFNSSIDEFASVPGWEDYIFLYKDEVDAIAQICNYFKDDESKQFILRIHPNLKDLDNSQTQDLKKLNSIDNLIVYDATHSISTYQLIEISSKIITFGSTVGIEATYFERPSISLGLSFYMYQDVVYIPKDKKELYELIQTEDLNPKPKENTYPYGYWIQGFGVPFKYRGKDFPEKLFSLKGVNKLVYWVIVFFSKDFLLKLKSSKYRKYIFNKYFLRKFQK